VVVLSVTEGEDKPLKYPVMFKAADLVLISKADLVPHLDVDVRKIEDALARVMPRPEHLFLSARTGQGLDAWVAWLEKKRLEHGLLGKVSGLATHVHPKAGAPAPHVHGPGVKHEH
jgi:hydrogenase nickel incorporation protein HypB